MENNKLTIGDLIEAFTQCGYKVSPSWVRRQEDRGNLFLPKSTTNFKMAQGARQKGAVREMSRVIINDVLKAFLPEGTVLPNGEVATGNGYYNYKKQEEHA